MYMMQLVLKYITLYENGTREIKNLSNSHEAIDFSYIFF